MIWKQIASFRGPIRYMVTDHGTLILHKRNAFTGNMMEHEIKITELSFLAGLERWNSVCVQISFPTLNDGDREFIMTGTTPQTWKTWFGSEE